MDYSLTKMAWLTWKLLLHYIGFEKLIWMEEIWGQGQLQDFPICNDQLEKMRAERLEGEAIFHYEEELVCVTKPLTRVEYN